MCVEVVWQVHDAKEEQSELCSLLGSNALGLTPHGLQRPGRCQQRSFATDERPLVLLSPWMCSP